MATIHKDIHLATDARRLAYAVVDGPFTHHHASMWVSATEDGSSRLTWITDLLPDELVPAISGLVDQGAAAMQHALGSATTSAS